MKDYLRNEIDPAFRRRAKVIIENIGNINSKQVLEVGCGRGFYLKTLISICPKAKITGIEINQKYVDNAKSNIKGVRVMKADAHHLPFANNTFDRIIASEILEHVDDDKKVLSEMFRVLKKKGEAVITVPNANYPFSWDPLNWVLERLFNKHINSENWYFGGIWADHQRLYTDKKLSKLIKDVGFKIVKKWSSTHYCLPAASFWFYGVGKHLVEAGIAKNFDRFDFDKKPGFLIKAVLWVIDLFDKINSDSEIGRSTVNLIYKISK